MKGVVQNRNEQLGIAEANGLFEEVKKKKKRKYELHPALLLLRRK